MTPTNQNTPYDPGHKMTPDRAQRLRAWVWNQALLEHGPKWTEQIMKPLKPTITTHHYPQNIDGNPLPSHDLDLTHILSPKSKKRRTTKT